jgi:hypothetical protein
MTPPLEPRPPQSPAFTLRGADRNLKLFITVFLFILTCGYLTGLLFVNHTTSGAVQGLSEEYRGSPEGSVEGSNSPELKYPKSADEMYILLHNHVLSLSLVFFAVGGIFYFSSIVPAGVKGALMLEPLLAVGTTFGGIWLMRFVAEGFSWLVLISGISMAACYFAMVVLILWELWSPRR